MTWAREVAATVTDVHPLACPTAAWVDERRPTVVALATESPGRWRLADVVTLATRWPLAAVVAVAGTLGDGSRRSGPRLPGIEDIAWNEFPYRLSAWLAALDAGRPGSLGSPPAARREDRLLLATAGLGRCPAPERLRVSVAAADTSAAEGLADLVAALGHERLRCRTGRPPMEDAADAVVWGVTAIDATVLVWLRLLVSAAPHRPVLLVDGFPRSDTTLRALHAGATAVLGRPLALETLAGALRNAVVSPRPALGEP